MDGLDEMKVMLDEGAFLPERAHEADAGYDIRTPIPAYVPAKGSAIIDSGVHMAIPKGYVGILKSKSGLNVKHDLIGTGTIDSGFNGSIRVKLYNLGDKDYFFKAGDKVIQIVLYPIYTPNLVQVEQLEETERGDGSLGSTGR